jgi:hypothetical protein
MEHREGIVPKMHFRRLNEICKLLILFEHVGHRRHQEGIEVTVYCTTLHDGQKPLGSHSWRVCTLNRRAPSTLEFLRIDARDT